MATGGEPYLRTPEDEMSFIVRKSLGLCAITMACCYIFSVIAKGVLQLLLSMCSPVPKTGLADGSLPWVPMMCTPKAKVN